MISVFYNMFFEKLSPTIDLSYIILPTAVDSSTILGTNANQAKQQVNRKIEGLENFDFYDTIALNCVTMFFLNIILYGT